MVSTQAKAVCTLHKGMKATGAVRKSLRGDVQQSESHGTQCPRRFISLPDHFQSFTLYLPRLLFLSFSSFPPRSHFSLPLLQCQSWIWMTTWWDKSPPVGIKRVCVCVSACLLALEGMKEKTHWVSQWGRESKVCAWEKKKKNWEEEKAKFRQRVKADCKEKKWERVPLEEKEMLFDLYLLLLNKYTPARWVCFCFFRMCSKALRHRYSFLSETEWKVRDRAKDREREKTRGQKNSFSFVGSCKRL